MPIAIDVRHDERERETPSGGHDLVLEQLDATAEEQRRRPPLTAVSAKKPEQQRADQTADEVHGDHVEAVVEPEHLLDLQCEVADRCRRSAR